MPYFKSEVALLFLASHGITVDRSLSDKDNRRGAHNFYYILLRNISEPQMGIKPTRPSARSPAGKTFYNRRAN